MDIVKLILERAKKEKRKIGIGILQNNLGSAEKFYPKASDYANIIPKSSYNELLKSLEDGEIEGIVRGQLDSSYILFHELSHRYKFKKDYRVSIIRDVTGRCFFFGPTGVRWNYDIDTKMEYIIRVVNHMNFFGFYEDIKIALLLPMHRNDLKYLLNIQNELDPCSLEQLESFGKACADTDILERNLKKAGYNVEIFDNRLEIALKYADFIVPFNGVIGNAISRALWLIDNRNFMERANLISLQLLTENYYDWVVENTASTEDNYFYHFVSAVAWLNRKI